MKLSELKKSQFIKLVHSLMLAKFPGYTIKRNIKAASGLVYQLDVVCECHELNRVLERIIIVCEKQGEPIELYDAQAFEEYAKDLEEMGAYNTKRDEVWFYLDNGITKEATQYYKASKAKFKIFTEKQILNEIRKYKNRDEAKPLRERIATYGIKT